MSDTKDYWTKAIDRALDIVFAKHPARTGLGVILGCALAFFAKLFEPTLRDIPFLDITSAPAVGWIPVGVLITHSPSLLFLVRRKPIGHEDVDEVIELIEKANFSPAEKRQQYRSLIANAAQRIALSQKTQGEIGAVKRSITGDEPKSE